MSKPKQLKLFWSWYRWILGIVVYPRQYGGFLSISVYIGPFAMEWRRHV